MITRAGVCANFPLLTIKELLQAEGGATCRNSIVISDSHLDVGHQWSDRHHLDGLRYSSSLAPGSICFHFLRPVFGTVAADVMATTGHHVVNFSPGGGFSICKTAHRIWLRILPVALENKLKVLDMFND